MLVRAVSCTSGTPGVGFESLRVVWLDHRAGCGSGHRLVKIVGLLSTTTVEDTPRWSDPTV